jgi:hypothetical protein
MAQQESRKIELPEELTKDEMMRLDEGRADRWGTPRGRYDEHNSKFSLSKKPRFNRPVGERSDL